MRFIGAGSCSVVFAFSEEEERELVHLLGLPVNLSHFALRLSRLVTSQCPICLGALRQFVGWRCAVELTDGLRALCVDAYPPLGTRCRDARHAELVSNFSVDPCRLWPPSVPEIGENKVGTVSLVVEIKPKSAWKQPYVVGISVDDQIYYLHPVKLCRCRFSLMRLLKEKRECKQLATVGVDHSLYCPNQMLLGDQLSIMDALLRLGQCPSNNLALISSSNDRDALDELDRTVVSVALKESGVFPILVNLQLYGSNAELEWPVLDIELLYRWSTARDASTVRWIVQDVHHSLAREVKCSCQMSVCERYDVMSSKIFSATHLLVPPLSLEECVERFYTSTTAKDVSVLVAFSGYREPALPSPVGSSFGPITTGAGIVSSGSVVSFGRESLHGGVMLTIDRPVQGVCRVGVVDIDDKRHKPLWHYFFLDQDILEAWEKFQPTL
ncbi:putative Inositol pentakisphosphate 2 kinase [Trypanosoma vivax]|uniref:Inositol-pentakisphosphate 2-kinase n=1 Tax=Trypanosoma vivax (strain Y486) TaxID=1055687 RepID=G0TTX9_TRYVY|nr:hypothetical protein TRVL_02090 [Trypanosoma vivax]KAH8613662.1 putative Inositol pentakisphosphate 2 kinase [Trypanosoma vivax]CCC47412.1 conserved hypothetical protein [Trypanosoma vivax Y486]